MLVVFELSTMYLVQVYSHHGVEVVVDLQGLIAMACQSVVVEVLLASVARVLRKVVHGLVQVARSGGVL